MAASASDKAMWSVEQDDEVRRVFKNKKKKVAPKKAAAFAWI